jgi:hypothetical protein
MDLLRTITDLNNKEAEQAIIDKRNPNNILIIITFEQKIK